MVAGAIFTGNMRRRGVLGALSLAVAASSGCLTNVQAPGFNEDPDRPPLAREDFVSNEEAAPRETVVPSVSLLSVASSETQRSESRAVTPESGTDTESTTDTASTTNATRDGQGDQAARAPDRTFRKQGLYVTDDFWRHRTHIHRYNDEEVTTTVYPIEPSNERSVKVVVAAYVYPRGEVVDTVTSDGFHPGEAAEDITLSIDISGVPTGTSLQYVTAVIPERVPPESITADDLYAIMETDPFELQDHGISRVTPPERLESASGPEFERQRVEGGYVQTLRGRTNGRSWTVSYLAFESAYAAASRRSRGRSRAEYVSFELMEGAANEIASLLYEQAPNHGFTSEFERIQFAVSFVQRLPYVPDDVSQGYDDYTQFIMETLTGMRGDCEDTSILLASILESEPYNYDAVLLEPPGHMAVGLLMKPSFDGFAYIYEGRKYYYVETTTEGWGIGQIPDQYRDDTAEVYDV
jgi:hypothetical protein